MSSTDEQLSDQHFTDEQRDIIDHPGGHARIVAVAGSGKTATLTAYVSRRIREGLSPRRLLVLMYNKTAQQDFTRRLNGQNPSGTRLPEVRTFHSLGYRIYQRLVQDGELPAFDRTIMSDAQVEPMVWRILRGLAEGDQAEDILTRKKKWVEPALAYFELVKSSLNPPDLVFEQSGLPSQCRIFVDAFEQFEQWRQDQRRVTFSDLLYDPVRCLNSRPDLADRFGGHMQEILVDEYQDINPIQQRLLEIVYGGRGQVMVVGDPDQTIYEFRGSEPTLLTEGFTDSFGQVRDYELSWTFRYGHHLSLLANHLIGAQHPHPDSRTLCYSHTVTPPTRVEQVRSDDGASTALGLIQQIRKQRPLTDIAVLNRLWANSARLELLLMAADVPYHLDHHQTVLERFELRPFWVLFDLASGDFSRYDPDSRRQAWQTLLTQPYLKIRKVVIDDLVSTLASVATDSARHLRNAIPESLSGYQADQLMERARLLQKAEQATVGAAELLSGWIRGTDYYAALKESAFSAQQVDDQVATVKAFAQFVAAQDWPAAEASPRLRQWQQRKADASAKGHRPQGVHITSIHKAKGREWPIVILPEVNARFYPYHPEGDLTRPTSEASERRLLYVAMTRAREHLVLLTPADRGENPDSPFVNDLRWLGSTDLAHALNEGARELTLSDVMDIPMVNRYINAVNSPLSVHWQAAPRGKDAVADMDPDASDSADTRRISHSQWGVGRIVHQDAQRLRIRFVRTGQERTFDREAVAPFLEWL